MKQKKTHNDLRMDLHIHSCFSDGTYSIDEIFSMAKKQGLSHIAIADHDTIKGLNEVQKVAGKYSIKAIPAIEISAYSFSSNSKVHVLAYGYSQSMTHTEKLCDQLLKRRTKRSIEQIKKLKRFGYDIDIVEVQKIACNSTAIYKQHIIEALVNNGYTKKIFSPLYDQLFKERGICHGDIDYIDVQEAIRAVKKDGCLAIIAHPGKSSCLGEVKNLIKLGLDGLEMNHPDHVESDLINIQQLARQYSLVLSGGSDYHGHYGSSPFIGCCEVPCADQFLEKLIATSGIHSIIE